MNRQPWTAHTAAIALAGCIQAAILLTGSAGAQDNYRAKAFAAVDAGDYPRAADLFMKLYRAGADDKEMLQSAVQCLERTGRFNDALDVLTRGTKRFPDDATFRVGRARVFNLKAASTYKSHGKMDSNVVLNFEDAIREAKAALAKWPENRDARLILANSQQQLGRWDEAKTQAEELVKRFPEHPGGFIILGDLAFAHYKILRQRATGADADTSEATLKKIVGSREAARSSYEKAIELDGKRVVAHVNLGNVFAWNGEVKRALQKYGDAMLLDPTAAVDHGWISSATAPADRFAFYETLGKTYMAGQGADQRKAAVFAWYGAAALIADKKYKEGEELYAMAVTLNPDFLSGFYHAMYSAYFFREDIDAALHYAAEYAKKAPIQFADVIRSTPRDDQDRIAQLVRYLAKRAAEGGRADVSRDLNHVLAAIADTADAWNNFAFMARESGQFDKSEKAYRNALAIEPTSGQLMNDLAVILHYHKATPENLAEADALYRKAIPAAETVLRDPNATQEQKAVARQTIQDAKGNLVKLKETLAELAKTRAKQAATKKSRADIPGPKKN